MAIDKNKIIEAATKFVQKGQYDKAVKEIMKARGMWEGMKKQTHWLDFLDEEIACLRKKTIRRLV